MVISFRTPKSGDHINGEDGLSWNDVARIRIQIDMTDSADGVRSVEPGDLVDKLGYVRKAEILHGAFSALVRP